jgi:hypothetical protein
VVERLFLGFRANRFACTRAEGRVCWGHSRARQLASPWALSPTGPSLQGQGQVCYYAIIIIIIEEETR